MQLESIVPVYVQSLPSLLLVRSTVTLLPARAEGSVVRVAIHEGRNRQVRRMFDAIHHPVTRLKRVSFGGLFLNNLQRGKHRKLTAEELGKLQEAVAAIDQ